MSTVTCPACGGDAKERLYRASALPVHSSVLVNRREDALNLPLRDLELAYCQGCGFIFNCIFDPDVMAYSPDFEESQAFSGTFAGYAAKLAREIADRTKIQGKRVLEIGCGKGEFLRQLCALDQQCSGLGIDPGYRADRSADGPEDGVEFIEDFFGSAYADLDADVVICRHTLEHIGPVKNFVSDIRTMIGEREDVAVVFETPDTKRILAEAAFWDIYYEHCSYFSAGSHARLFRQNGFDVTDLELVYDQQYIVQYAEASEGQTVPHLPLERDLDTIAELAASFPKRVQNKIDDWRQLFDDRAKSGDDIVVWGGGSKAVGFLTTLGYNDAVSRVVDINPFKQGKFLPGPGHPVVAPDALRDSPPRLVVLMNPIYEREVGETLQELGIEAELLPLS